MEPTPTTSTFRGTSRGYLYTIWCTPAVAQSYCQILDSNEEITHYTGQCERGGASGREHLQLYIEFKRNTKGVRIQRLLGLQRGSYWYEFEMQMYNLSSSKSSGTVSEEERPNKRATIAPRKTPELQGLGAEVFSFRCHHIFGGEYFDVDCTNGVCQKWRTNSVLINNWI